MVKKALSTSLRNMGLRVANFVCGNRIVRSRVSDRPPSRLGRRPVWRPSCLRAPWMKPGVRWRAG